MRAEDLTDATGQPIGKQGRTSDHGIFYQGSSGIWRTVWMEPVPAAHIASLTLTPSVTSLKIKVNAVSSTGVTARVSVPGVGSVSGPVAETQAPDHAQREDPVRPGQPRIRPGWSTR